MRLGIFGGTFDPIHNGHIACAMAIRESFSLDRVLFIPSKIPVHKTERTVVSADSRAQMISHAISGIKGFELSRIEIDRDTPSYSVLTVNDIRRQNPASDIFFILGVDAFNELRTWRDYTGLMQMVSFIVMRRNAEIVDPMLLAMSEHIFIAENDEVDISSSAIRQLIKERGRADGLVPDSVAEFIRSRRLYIA